MADKLYEANIEIWTDGGCHGNPGPGAWAFVIVCGGKIITEKSGGEKETTNNRMELLAVINALEDVLGGELGVVSCELGFETREAGSGQSNQMPTSNSQPPIPRPLTILTDSQYVKNGITTWIHDWKRRGWKTAAKKPVKNQDLWQRLDSLSCKLKPRWQWVRGHSGTALNERCDFLVQKAMELIN